MKIWFRIHGFEPCSWTYVWENLRNAFDARDDVELYGLTPPMDGEDCIELWWGDPQFWSWSDMDVEHRVALVLSEARSILASGRERAIQNVAKADLVICPSRAATVAFEESPVDSPIVVAPFGVDSAEFSYTERDWVRKPFTFLHAGVTQFRKGSWMVPEAFIKAFGERDDVRLMVASPRSSPMFTRLNSEYGRHPQMDFVTDLKDSSYELYKQAHVYISPHLSEGFGLMIPEAMSTGMPCIVSRCSAPREFFSPDYGWWVEMSENYAPVTPCLPDTAGLWRLPSLESLANTMRLAYENRDECESIGKAASEYVAESLSWELTAQKICRHIKEILLEGNISNTPSIQRRETSAALSQEYRAIL